jgi:hypothetical protein
VCAHKTRDPTRQTCVHRTSFEKSKIRSFFVSTREGGALWFSAVCTGHARGKCVCASVPAVVWVRGECAVCMGECFDHLFVFCRMPPGAPIRPREVKVFLEVEAARLLDNLAAIMGTLSLSTAPARRSEAIHRLFARYNLPTTLAIHEHADLKKKSVDVLRRTARIHDLPVTKYTRDKASVMDTLDTHREQQVALQAQVGLKTRVSTKRKRAEDAARAQQVPPTPINVFCCVAATVCVKPNANQPEMWGKHVFCDTCSDSP